MAPLAAPFIVVLLSMLLLTIVGVGLIITGWRGRRVGDHPTCRACGFDLFAAPDDQARCPECGADLAKSRAKAIGHRVRMPRRMIAGAVLMLVCLGFVGLVGPHVWGSIPWNRLRPTWYAIREARGALPGDRTTAIDELIRRDGEGELDARQNAQLIDLLIAHHDDSKLAWAGDWTDWLANQLQSGRMSRTERDAFVRSMFPTPFVRVRPTVRSGPTTLPISYGFAAVLRPGVRGPRAMGGPTRDDLCLAFRNDDLQVFIDGAPLALNRGSGGGRSTRLGFGASTSDSISIPGRLSPGLHEIAVRTVAQLGRFSTLNDGPSLKKGFDAVPLEARTTFTVLPPGQASVTRIADPSLAATLHSLIAPSITTAGEYSTIELRFDHALLPVGIGFDAYVKQDGVEHDVGTLAASRGSGRSTGGSSIFSYSVRVSLSRSPIELRLAPSVEAAEKTENVTEIWGGELRYPDVPVTTR